MYSENQIPFGEYKKTHVIIYIMLENIKAKQIQESIPRFFHFQSPRPKQKEANIDPYITFH